MTIASHRTPASTASPAPGTTRRDLLRRGAALAAAPAVTRLAAGPAARAQDVTTINFLHSIPDETAAFWETELLPGFYEANPGCRINAQNYGTEDSARIRTQVQAGGESAPDMAWLASGEQGVYAEANLLADVQGWLDAHAEIRDNIIPSLLALSSYSGAARTLPWTTNNLAVWINVDAFDAAGLAVPGKDPETTWTWEEFADAAAKTTSGDRKGFLATVGGGWESWAFHAWLAQAGGTFLFDDGTPGFAGPEGVEAMTFLKSLVDAGSTAFSEPNQGFDAGPWYAGRVAMTLNGPWNFPALRDFTDFKIDVVPYPRHKQPATNLGGNQLYIFNVHGDAAVDCAFAYAEYMLSDDFQIQFCIQDGSFPVTQSATESEEFAAHLEAYPWLAGWRNQTPFGVARSSLPQSADVFNLFSDAYDEIMLNNADIPSTLAAAAAEAESYRV